MPDGTTLRLGDTPYPEPLRDLVQYAHRLGRTISQVPLLMVASYRPVPRGEEMERLLRSLDDQAERSFRVLLKEYTESVRRHIKRELGKIKLDLCIGTGGNLEEMGKHRKKIFKRDSNHLITVSELETLNEKLSNMSVGRRMKKFNLKPDRADAAARPAVSMS